jgi:hypothetical protein
MEKIKFEPDWMKDPETMKVLFREAMLERDHFIAKLIEEKAELQHRIDTVLEKCGVPWINETLQGKNSNRTELIRQLSNKACDRNDKALKKMEECKVDKNQIIVNGRIFPFNFPVFSMAKRLA